MIRKNLLTAATILASAALLTGCASSGGDGANDVKSVSLLLPGTTGDGGFYDQAAAGVTSGAKAAGWTSRVVEAGYDGTKWGPALDDLAGGNDSLIITGTFAMIDLLKQAALTNPDKQYVIFDAEVPGDNVYSITYRYDETGFLAGALAGLLATDASLDRLDGTGVVGVVGGLDIPVIQDYIRGFEVGVKIVAPDVKVVSAFAGSFNDPVKGNAVAKQMIDQGAQIIFTAAGGTDQGVIQAAADADVWAIGNAQSQADNPQVNGKDAVLTAASTNVEKSIDEAVASAAAGKLPVGTTESYGAANGAVYLVDSPLYKKVVPQATQDQMTALMTKLVAGDFDDALKAK